jgi:hypothetical protein
MHQTTFFFLNIIACVLNTNVPSLPTYAAGPRVYAYHWVNRIITHMYIYHKGNPILKTILPPPPKKNFCQDYYGLKFLRRHLPRTKGKGHFKKGENNIPTLFSAFVYSFSVGKLVILVCSNSFAVASIFAITTVSLSLNFCPSCNKNQIHYYKASPWTSAFLFPIHLFNDAVNSFNYKGLNCKMTE